jgi:hypothetical protein
MFNYGTKFAGLGQGTFPNFSANNASGPTATDGFPYTADSVNDWIGFTQDLLNRAGLTPNGQAEVAGASQLIAALTMGAAHTPGEVVQTAIPTQAKRAQNRLLDLVGQIISITGAYAPLSVNVYCGDAANPTAPAFYKCDASGNRSTSGAYMKLPDCRGMFLRGAGQNGTYRMASDAPYDGKSIGEKGNDAIRNIKGNIFVSQGGPVMASGAFTTGGTTAYENIVNGVTSDPAVIIFDASRWVPTSNENTPVWIAVYVCIRY